MTLYLIQIPDRSVAIETEASFVTERLVRNTQDALEIPDVVLLRTPTLTARRTVQASSSEIYSFAMKPTAQLTKAGMNREFGLVGAALGTSITLSVQNLLQC